MARGAIKPVSEKIAEIDKKIEAAQAKLGDLKAQRKELLEAGQQEKLKRILEIADERGLSVDDVLAKLSQ